METKLIYGQEICFLCGFFKRKVGGKRVPYTERPELEAEFLCADCREAWRKKNDIRNKNNE